MAKVIVGGLLGGLNLFLWGAVSHELLPLGEAGLRTMPPAREAAVLAAMRGAMTERSVYVFPGLDTRRTTTAAERAAWTARFTSGPAGVVAFDPHPGQRLLGGSLIGTLMGTELLCSILAATLGGALILRVPAAVGYRRRVLLVAALGVVAALDVDAGYWNWYGFPTSYFLAQLVDHAVGWLAAGLVLARVCRQ